MCMRIKKKIESKINNLCHESNGTAFHWATYRACYGNGAGSLPFIDHMAASRTYGFRLTFKRLHN